MTLIKKNFGFGFMRLPMKDGEIDNAEVCRMVDVFLENGFNYFDTAHGYHNGKSEIAIKECLTSRHPRESYVLTNKLSTQHFESNAEIRPLFESQLVACGVDYFDYYLMHAQSAQTFAKYKRCSAYETALEFLKEGKIRHLGISFHDTAEVLEQILTEYPQIEVVQIQFNYADYDDPVVQSRLCYEVCHKFGKPVIVMEPCRGGNLVNMPEEISAVFRDLGGGSNASYAIRFAAGFPGVMMVLSGMGNMDMMLDNISYMKDFKPLSEREQAAVGRVCELFRAKNMIACTACRYCTEGCPANIMIPDLFACLNSKKVFNSWNTDFYYHNVHTVNHGKASDCIKCGNCETICPQRLPIRRLLEDVAAEFEKKNT
ncbi:MAG: aldo/keto reductase [Clostridia bacterium]|nr:aldo/keto reductase [Clostridia bacterium]